MDDLFNAFYNQDEDAHAKAFTPTSMYKYFRSQYRNELLTIPNVTRWVNNKIASVLKEIYYGPGGFMGAKPLHDRALQSNYKITQVAVKDWLSRQATQQDHKPLKKELRSITLHFNQPVPNHTHQLDTLVVPMDASGYSRILCIVDVATRYKAARPLKTGEAKEALAAVKDIYETESHLSRPQTMMTDGGPEFKGEFNTYFTAKGTQIKRAVLHHHQSQSIVESFNRVLAKRLFKAMEFKENKLVAETGAKIKDYGVDFRNQRALVNKEWLANLQPVVAQLNTEYVYLLGKKPIDMIKTSYVQQPTNSQYEIDLADHVQYNLGDLVKYYLDETNVAQGKRRTTDRTWSANIYAIDEILEQAGRPRMYKLIDQKSRKPLGFTVIGTRLMRATDKDGMQTDHEDVPVMKDYGYPKIPKWLQLEDLGDPPYPPANNQNVRRSARIAAKK